MLQYHGLDVIHKEAEDDYGLPRTLTLDTLQNEQYLFVKSIFTVLARFLMMDLQDFLCGCVNVVQHNDTVGPVDGRS